MAGTRLINKRELKRHYAANPQACVKHLSEALWAKDISVEDLSIRDLAEAVVPHGEEWVEGMDSRWSGRRQQLFEDDAIMTTHFTQLTKQMVYMKMLEGFENEDYVFLKNTPKVNTKYLYGEVIPGVTNLGDVAETIQEGNEYPRAGVTEDWIRTSPPQKRGFVVPITKEMVFADNTGAVIRRASMVGEAMGLNLEKRAIDCWIDGNRTDHRYNWKGTVIATYGDSSGTHNWDNLAASNALVDYTDVDAIELLLASIVDPHTGEPITNSGDTLWCGLSLRRTAKSVIQRTQVQFGPGGSTSATAVVSFGANPLNDGSYDSKFKILSSALFEARLTAASIATTTWYFGKPSKAFARMVNWDLKVEKTSGGDEDFYRDIVVAYKGSERSVFATMEPRVVGKCTA